MTPIERMGTSTTYSQTVKELTSVEQKDALKQAVNGLTARGATCADYGMELARDILLKDTSDNPKVVIMFTDGTPTAFNGFEKPVADAAISASHQIKANGATVYTVGILAISTGPRKCMTREIMDPLAITKRLNRPAM